MPSNDNKHKRIHLSEEKGSWTSHWSRVITRSLSLPRSCFFHGGSKEASESQRCTFDNYGLCLERKMNESEIDTEVGS